MANGVTPGGRPAPAGPNSKSPAETVAVLGAGGMMGSAMTRNIARAGIGVRAWNRTRARAEPLRAAAWQHGLELPLFEVIARRLAQAAGEHGDEDISATYLTSAPEHAA